MASMHLDQFFTEGKCKEGIVKGYNVRVQYNPRSLEEQNAHKQAIANTVL